MKRKKLKPEQLRKISGGSVFPELNNESPEGFRVTVTPADLKGKVRTSSIPDENQNDSATRRF